MAASLTLLSLALFHQALLGQRVLFQRDLHWVWYPRVESLVRAVAAGGWPLWDPHPTFGAPALADPSYQLAYPPTWLNLILRPAYVYALFAAGHALLAGLGLYALARAWGQRTLGAGLAAAAFMLSGPLLSYVDLNHHFAGLAWMPWVLWALERLLARPTHARALVLGTVLAAQVLAGSGDMGLMGALLGCGRLALWAAGSRATGAGRVARGLVLAALLAAGASAVQWLATVSILDLGSRLSLPPASNLYWSLHPAALADLLVPGLVAELPMSAALRARLYESREPFLACLYLGLPLVALALLGLVVGRDRRRWATVAAAAVFVVLALGRFTPVYSALVSLPPFSVLRYPVKYMAVVALLVTLLGGHGLHAWCEPWERAASRRARLLALGLTLVAAALLAGAVALSWHPSWLAGLLAAGADQGAAATRLRNSAALAVLTAALLAWRTRAPRASPLLTAALVLLVLGDLLAVGRRINVLAPPALAAYRPAWVTRAQAAGLRRLYVVPLPLGGGSDLRMLPAPAGWSGEWWWTLGVQDHVLPPIGERWGFDGSYDGDFTGLGSLGVSVAGQFLAWARSQPTGVKMLRMGSVDAVVSLSEEPGLGPELLRVESVFPEPIRVHRVPDPLPRAYVVDGVLAPEDETEAYGLLRQARFDPRRQVILSGVPAGEPGEGSAGRAWVVERRCDRLRLEAELTRPGQLVVTEAWAPGWRAEVDGQPARVHRANLFFRALELPAGRHLVEMRYRPRAPLVGALLSALTWLGLGVLALRRAGLKPPVARFRGGAVGSPRGREPLPRALTPGAPGAERRGRDA